jgi:HEAT repeat protein
MANDILYKGRSVGSWVEALKNQDASARSEAVDSLLGICTSLTAVLPALTDVLKEGDAVTRTQTAVAVGEFGSRAINMVSVLRSALRTAVLTAVDADERSAASEALVQIGPQARSVLPVLVDNLKDELPTIRWTSANALGEMGSSAREAMPALTAIALNDNVPRVRVEAAVALWRIDRRPHRVVPVLIDALQETDEVVRWIAADCLGDIGSDACDALPALREALNLPYKARLIRIGVATAIERIELA